MIFWNKAKEFLKGFFTKNITLKIISVVLALLLWVIFAAVENPAVTETYTIPLNIKNLQQYEDAGHYVHLEDGSDLSDISLSVSIRAPKSTLQEIALSGATKAISASADVFDIENGILTIFYEVLPDYVGQVEFNTISNTSFINVISEEIVAKTVSVGVSIVGTPANGYFVKNADLSKALTTQVVTVSGPESLMNRLDHAAIICSVEGLKASIQNEVFTIRFYDAEDKELALSSGLCNFSATIAEASLPLYREYDLNLELEVNGTPLEGWVYNYDAELSKTKVRVYALAEEKGCPSTLTLAENILDKSGTLEYTRDLSKLINQKYPAISLKNEADAEVKITINIVQEEIIEE